MLPCVDDLSTFQVIFWFYFLPSLPMLCLLSLVLGGIIWEWRQSKRREREETEGMEKFVNFLFDGVSPYLKAMEEKKEP
jgi:hypothetical protein